MNTSAFRVWDTWAVTAWQRRTGSPTHTVKGLAALLLADTTTDATAAFWSHNDHIWRRGWSFFMVHWPLNGTMTYKRMTQPKKCWNTVWNVNKKPNLIAKHWKTAQRRYVECRNCEISMFFLNVPCFIWCQQGLVYSSVTWPPSNNT